MASGLLIACGHGNDTDCRTTATCSTAPLADASPPEVSGDGSFSNGTSSDGGLSDASPDVTREGSVSTANGADGSRAGVECSVDADCEAGTICSADGACVPGCNARHGCKGAEACCGSSCIDVKSDVQHCGGCSACVVANGTPACTEGACKVAKCAAGYFDCDLVAGNGCETPTPAGPSVPNPTRPAIGTHTGSLRGAAVNGSLKPQFKWTSATADGCGAVHYQIQIDDSCDPTAFLQCTFSSPEVDQQAATNSFTPAKDLPVSQVAPVGARYYWRVRACDAADICSPWSAVRYVDVGRLGDDVNGDGYSDILVGQGGSTVFLFLGGKGMSPYPASTGSLESQSYGPGAFAGDLNGDGYADFILCDEDAIPGPGTWGAAKVYVGKALFPSMLGAPQYALGRPLSMPDLGYFPAAVAAAGDFNGDGLGDFLATPWAATEALLYLQARTPESITIKRLPLQGAVAQNGFGRAGDLDGDGYDDIGVLSRGETGASIVAFWAGAPIPATTPYASYRVDYMERLVAAGDLNGDGYDDVALSGQVGPNSGDSAVLTTFWGKPTFAKDLAPLSRVVKDPNFPLLGLAGGIDANADGFADLFWTPKLGSPLAIAGAATYETMVPTTLSSDSPFLGASMTVGDYDGDGYGDLVIAATSAEAGDRNGNGSVSVRFAKQSVPLALVPGDPISFGRWLAH